MLIYHANWRSIYFDLFAFGLSTVDPFVHPVTCILVSRRYRAGYADAFKDIMSRIRGWICSFKPRARVDPLDYTPSVSNTYNSGLIHVTWQHESRVNLRNNCDNSAQCATPKAHASFFKTWCNSRKLDKRTAFRVDKKSYPVWCEHLFDKWRSTLEIGAAPLRYKMTVLMCEQKLYHVWFSCRRKNSLFKLEFARVRAISVSRFNLMLAEESFALGTSSQVAVYCL